jgi:flagellar biosynthetic protein FliQ
MGLQDYILNVAQQALYLVLLVSAPVILVSVAVGLVFGVLQAATQVQAHTLSFVPKLVAVALVLALTASWMGAQIMRFTSALWTAIPNVVR